MSFTILTVEQATVLRFFCLGRCWRGWDISYQLLCERNGLKRRKPKIGMLFSVFQPIQAYTQNGHYCKPIRPFSHFSIIKIYNL